MCDSFSFIWRRKYLGKYTRACTGKHSKGNYTCKYADKYAKKYKREYTGKIQFKIHREAHMEIQKEIDRDEGTGKQKSE